MNLASEIEEMISEKKLLLTTSSACSKTMRRETIKICIILRKLEQASLTDNKDDSDKDAPFPGHEYKHGSSFFVYMRPSTSYCYKVTYSLPCRRIMLSLLDLPFL